MKSICIIPARGGSKRLPRKNILPLGGVPMLVRVVNSAKDAGVFDEVIVSSDDSEMLGLAEASGAIAHSRPEALGQDRSTVVEVCSEVLEHYEADIFCCIYATAALLSSETIVASHQSFSSDEEAGVLMGVSCYNYHPVQALTTNEGRFATPLFPDYKGMQSQFYPSARVSNGTFYWGRKKLFMKEQTFYSSKLKTFDVNDAEVCDVDTPDDYQKLISKFGT